MPEQRWHWPLQWPHNDHDGVSNHQPHGCSLKRLFRHRSKKTSKLRVTGLCVGNSPGPVNSPHKGPVTRKMFPFDDVIMPNFKFVSASVPSGSGALRHTQREIDIHKYESFISNIWRFPLRLLVLLEMGKCCMLNIESSLCFICDEC